ncbi:MAG TPA: DNA helicase, partial [Candidatus Saccharibacteria bacterium]|nr:DNA helicase [Candidatus Saccharibacteria bacterium]
NSKYYDQQEEIVYRNNLDQKAASETTIRELRKREKDARLKARQETDPLKQLEYKKEARKWEQRAEEEDDRARDERREASRRAEEYLDLIEESLKGNQEIEDIFTVSWEIVE